jgi:hypothetical protein
LRQRLGLAATLLGDPAVLILDEPANGLDPQGIRWLRDFLRSMAAEGRHGARLQPRARRGRPDRRRRGRDPPWQAGRPDDPARVGELAFEAGVPLHELTTRATSLEEAFLALTRDKEGTP